MSHIPSLVWKVLPWLLILFLLLLLLGLTPESMGLKNFGLTEVGQLLASLPFIALFLERALEVFITTWRGPESAELDRLVDAQKATVDALKVQQPVNQAQLNQALSDLATEEQKRVRYKSETQRLALRAGLTLGLLVSAVGIRTLQTIIDAELLSRAAQSQRVLFHLVDIVLTGGVLAGGSEGIHKLTQVYTNFMEASAKQAKGT